MGGGGIRWIIFIVEKVSRDILGRGNLSEGVGYIVFRVVVCLDMVLGSLSK